MKKYLTAAIVLILATSIKTYAHPHLLNLDHRLETSFTEMIDDLAQKQVIFIGERHDHPGHHRMQLETIKALAKKNLELTIGLEMVRHEDQKALNDWVAGSLNEAELEKTFRKFWENWEGYKDIFRYAREKKIDLIGLNISRDITRQVARNGVKSLSPEQARQTGATTCVVTPAYRAFIDRALQHHGHSGKDFNRFCEAQLLWDTVMAKRLQSYMASTPERTIVVLSGSGHSWKHGIPTQLSQNQTISYGVLLPEDNGAINRFTARKDDADYLWMNTGPGSWNVP